LDRLRHLLIAAGLVISAVGPSLPAQQADAAIEQFVAFLDQSLHAIHVQAQTEGGGIHAGCRDLMLRILDLDGMGRAAAAAAWDKMTQSQRSAYQPAFERRLLSDCARPIRDYRGEPVALAGVRSADDGERLVAVRLGSENDPSRIITWRVRGEAVGTLKAVDIIVDGRSTVINMRNEFSAVLESQNGDIDALVEFLRK
jgi:ABC-type transporter MlaC component